MQNFFMRVMPFITFGIILVLLIVGIILLSYLLVFGALIGLALFGIAWLREKLFPSKNVSTEVKQGRTIDHDELK
ncbi:MAG: hypothetical protein P4M14_09155 [Gammaproteobacteria bacterium]|nr:hypothetical protein [Gammaproteobacteria bacterium]